MKDFNYKQWLQENKQGPYKSMLRENTEATSNVPYNVMAKTTNVLVAYPDPKGQYTKEQLTLWQTKGQERGESKNIIFVNSKDEAIAVSQGQVDEDTYPETYENSGDENPQPEDEQFQEGLDTIYNTIGRTNQDIEYYSDAELDYDNDVMPSDYSEPNPGIGADRDAAWKPKPFNNAQTSQFNRPNKYGW